MRINISSWNGLLHSYSIVAESYCLGLIKNPENKIFFTEYPAYQSAWKKDRITVFDNMTQPDAPVDITLRFAFPYDLSPDINAKCTIVFVTSEFNYVSSLLDAGDLCDNVWILTPSEFSKKGIVASGIPMDRIIVVPHCYDRIQVPLTKAELKAQYKLPINDFIFFHSSSMTGNKNPKSLLLAFEYLYRENPNITLLLKGVESLYGSDERLMETIQQLRLQLNGNETQRIASEQKYIYIGTNLPMSKMAELYEIADCYVSPFIAEGFNLPVLEALCHGLPVICTKYGPPDEFAKNGTYFIESDLCRGGEIISVNGNDMPKEFYFPKIVHMFELMKKMTSVRPTVDVEFFKQNYSTDTIGHTLHNTLANILTKVKEHYLIIIDDDARTQSMLDNLDKYCGNANVYVGVNAEKAFNPQKNIVVKCIIKDKTCSTQWGLINFVMTKMGIMRSIYVRNDLVLFCDPRSYASMQQKGQNILFNNGQTYMIVYNNANSHTTKNTPVDTISVCLSNKSKYRFVAKRNNVNMLFRSDGGIFKKVYFAYNDTEYSASKYVVNIEEFHPISYLLKQCQVAFIDIGTVDKYKDVYRDAPLTLAYKLDTIPSYEPKFDVEKLFVYPEMIQYFFEYLYPHKTKQFDLYVLPSNTTDHDYRNLDTKKLIKSVITEIKK